MTYDMEYMAWLAWLVAWLVVVVQTRPVLCYVVLWCVDGVVLSCPVLLSHAFPVQEIAVVPSHQSECDCELRLSLCLTTD